MPINKIRKVLAPINIKQSTLIKFCPDLPKPKKPDILVEKDKDALLNCDSRYQLSIESGNIVEIRETHCLDCGKRLKKNGFNNKVAILDEGLGRHKLKLHRKSCKDCGEIKPDYSHIAPRYGNYHENYKRRTRQHHMEGLMPSQIKQVFKIDFSVDISESNIVNWINEAAAPLRSMLEATPVPSSGYWGYDEIHLRVGGEKMYAINTVDMNTHFIPVARISPKMGKKAGREVLVEGRKKATLQINGLVKDCTTNLGGLFRTRSFKNIILQNCLTHVKWIASKHIKAFAGLSKQSKKPIPQEWRWLLKRFYALIDSCDETDAYIQLEIVRSTVERLKGKKIKELHVALRQLESWLPKIIAHQRNPDMPKTNNMTEGYHKKYERYPMFKKNMMIIEGAQRIQDYIVFKHNFKKFPRYIEGVRMKYKEYRIILTEDSKNNSLKGGGMYFKHKFLRLDKWYGNYMAIWNQFFSIF
ncbi:MAG: hypothetical protein ACTSR8_13160 [Promethearchaeota archaeon]